MKRLYDKNSKYNEFGDAVDLEAMKVINPIIDKWVDNGFCPRDIQNVLNGATLTHILSRLIMRKGAK